MPLNTKNEIDYRFERKYLTKELTKTQVEFLIKNHPENFSEIYHQRNVNNIYFDTLGMNNYNDNVDGSAFRTKYRIRWYGDLFGSIEKPILECKIKEGLVGKKESYELTPFILDGNFNKKIISQALEGTAVSYNARHDLLTMQPTLLNSYTRKYYLSFNKSFRATLDFNLCFYRIGNYNNTFLHKIKDNESVILELKYASDLDMEARQSLDFSPLYTTKSSKYVQGIDVTY